MKKIFIVLLGGLISASATAAYEFPENATISEANRIISLETLNYSIGVDKPKSIDDIKLCLAEVVDNDSGEIVKVETDTAVVTMGNIKIDKSGWGNDNVIKYELKVVNKPEEIKLKFYNIMFGYIQNNQSIDDVKLRKPATHFGGGGQVAVDSINSLTNKFKDCIEF